MIEVSREKYLNKKESCHLPLDFVATFLFLKKLFLRIHRKNK